MKKILIDQCLQCWHLDDDTFHCRQTGECVLNPYVIPADCPLEDDLPESKGSDNNGDWLSPVPSERKVQEKQLKALWPDYPNGCFKWQTMNGLLFYTNKFMELGEKPNGWIPEIREAVADYMFSEGCSCCRDIDAHIEHEKRLGELLFVDPYSDGSGYDFSKYRSNK